ncbi:MAG: hypothetical protein ACRD3T_08955 [Terriglobia bacterium]
MESTAAVTDRRYHGSNPVDKRVLIGYNYLSTYLAGILLMNQSAIAVPGCRIDAAVSRVGQIDPTTPSTNKATAKSAKSPIKMRVGATLSDARKGFYASKPTQLIENKITGFARSEQTHCEMGRNPVKMRV